MSTDRSYALHIIAETKAYQQELAKIPGFTDKEAAKAAHKMAERLHKGAQDAAKKVAAEFADNKTGLGRVADQAGDMERALKGVGDIAGQVSPQVKGLLNAAADLGGGLEGVIKGGSGASLALGAVGIAAAALGAAYLGIQSQLEAALGAQQRWSETASLATALSEDLARAELELAVATGHASQADLDAAIARDKAASTFEPLKKALEEEKAAVKAAIEEKTSFIGKAKSLGLTLLKLVPIVQILNKTLGLEVDIDTTSIETLEAKLDALEVQSANLAAGEEKLAGEIGKTTGARREASRAAEQHSAQIATLLRLQQAEIDADMELLRRMEELAVAQEGWAQQQRDLFKVDHLVAYEARLREIAKAEEEGAVGAQGAAALRAAALQEYSEAAVEAETRAADAARRAQEAAVRATTDAVNARLSVAYDLSGALMDLQSQAMERGGEEAKRAFKMGQTLAIAQIGFSGAQAAIAALSPPPVGYGPTPLGVAAAAAAGAAVLAQLAVVSKQEAPSFALGGGVPEPSSPAAMGRVPTVLHGGEEVIPAQDVRAAGGGAAVRDRVRGGASVAVTQIVMGHRVIEEALTDNARRGGALGRASRPPLRSSPYRRRY